MSLQQNISNTTVENNINSLAVFGIIFSIFCLATGGIFVKLSALDPIASGAWRIGLALPFIFYWQFTDRKYSKETTQHLTLGQIVIFWIAGIFLGFDLALWNISFYYTTIANANLLANMVPFIVIPLSYFIYKEKISSGFVFGLFFAVIGVIILISNKTTADGERALFGDALAALTAVFYALYILIVSKLRQKNSSASVMYWTGFGTLSVLIPLAVFFENNLIPTNLDELWPLLGLALIAHVGGQGLLAQCLRYVPVSLSSVLIISQPVVAAIYAWILFGEALTYFAALGIFICLMGIYVANRSTNK